MRVNSEAEMLKFGADFAKNLRFPAVIELLGDVGSGKTTFTRGLAEGLGVSEPITSPSFTLSKRYAFPLQASSMTDANSSGVPENLSPRYGELIHYDFYRLDDPGIMRDELADALSQKHIVVVVEWGGEVADLLPESKYHLEISQLDDNIREVKIFCRGKEISDLWKTCGKLSDSCGEDVQKPQNLCEEVVDKSQKPSAKLEENS